MIFLKLNVIPAWVSGEDLHRILKSAIVIPKSLTPYSWLYMVEENYANKAAKVLAALKWQATQENCAEAAESEDYAARVKKLTKTYKHVGGRGSLYLLVGKVISQ